MAESFLRRWFDTLDGERPHDVLDMITPDYQFCVLFGSDDGATEWIGDRTALEAYLAQREPDGQEHHIDVLEHDGDREIVFGHTTRHGEPLATYTAIAQLRDGRMRRLFSARTLRLHFD